jgi:hypothetical protein
MDPSVRVSPTHDLSDSPYSTAVRSIVHGPYGSSAMRLPHHPAFVREETRLATFSRHGDALPHVQPFRPRRNEMSTQLRVIGDEPVAQDDAERVDDERQVVHTHVRLEPPLSAEEADLFERLARTGLPTGSQRCYSNACAPPEKLAAVGFFTVLDGNEVRCFDCGLTLIDLRADCEPWIEHAFHRPDCAFVRTVRGCLFVRQVHERFGGAQPSYGRSEWGRSQNTPRNDDAAAFPDVPPYAPLTGFRVDVHHPFEGRYVRALAETRPLRSRSEDCTVRLSADFVRFAIEQRIRAAGREFESLLDLVDAVHHLNARMREMRISTPAEFVSVFMLQISGGLNDPQLSERPVPSRPGVARFEHREVGPPISSASSGIGVSQQTGTADQVRARSESSARSQDSGLAGAITCKLCGK